MNEEILFMSSVHIRAAVVYSQRVTLTNSHNIALQLFFREHQRDEVKWLSREGAEHDTRVPTEQVCIVHA